MRFEISTDIIVPSFFIIDDDNNNVDDVMVNKESVSPGDVNSPTR